MRSKLALIGTLLLLVAVFAAVTLTIQNLTRKEATAILRVDRQADKSTTEEYRITKRTYAQLLTSPHVLNTALGEIKPSQRVPVGHKEIVAALTTVNGDDELIAVKLRQRYGWSRHETTETLKAVVDAFIDEVVNKEQLEKFEELKKLRERYGQLYNEVVKQTEEMRTLSKALGVLDEAAIQRAFEMQKDKQLMLEEKLIQYRLEEVLVTTSDGPPKALSSQIKFLEQQVTDSREQMQNSRGTSGELDARRAVLAALKKNLASVSEQRTELEIELDRRPRVTIVQSPVFTD